MKVYDLSVTIYGTVQAENDDDAIEEFCRRIKSGEIDIETPAIERCDDFMKNPASTC